MIYRALEETIRRAMRTFPAVLVTGPRQSGKTTLLREVWGETHRYVSIENADVRRRAIADPAGFLKSNPPPCIIDEFQYIPDLLTYVKTAIDEDRRPGNWLLTGSQHFSLMEGVSQSLAGRVAVLALLPFSFAEVHGLHTRMRSIESILENDRFKDPVKYLPDASLDDWIIRGAYPEIRANPEVDRLLWCGSYVQTYLERDVRNILNVGDLEAFSRFIRHCALRTGQVLNYSDLARDTGISVPTAKKWLSVLVASHQCFLLPPYHTNLGKRLVKSPKLYFIDTGIASFITGQHDARALLSGPQAGAYFETMILSEWLKAFHNRGEPPAIYFWRSIDGLEIDFVIERNGKLFPMEVKLTGAVSPRDASSMEKLRSITGQRTDAVIYCTIARTEPVANGVTAVPWQLAGI